MKPILCSQQRREVKSAESLLPMSGVDCWRTSLMQGPSDDCDAYPKLGVLAAAAQLTSGVSKRGFHSHEEVGKPPIGLC